MTVHLAGVKTLQFDATKLVSGGADGKIFVWDLRSTKDALALPHRNGELTFSTAFQCLFSLEGHPGGVNSLQFDVGKIISGGEDKKLRIWSFS